MAKDYVEREAVLAEVDKAFKLFVEHDDTLQLYSDVRCAVIYAPAADVVEVPQEYACYTDFDDENYLVHLTIPISEKQFKALGEGADLWEVLRGGNDG